MARRNRPPFPGRSRLRGARELMDDFDGDESRLFATLDGFKTINRLIGRYRHVLSHYLLEPAEQLAATGYHVAARDAVRDVSAGSTDGATFSMIDLGTGAADVPIWLVRRAAEMGLRFEVTAVDHDPRVARYARQCVEDNGLSSQIDVRIMDVADSSALGRADFVYCGNMLHHLGDAAAADLLSAMKALARIRYVALDVRRSRAWWLAFRLLSLPASRHSFLHFDGPMSISRAFSKRELEELSHRAGAGATDARELFPGRLLLTGRGAAV